MVHSWTDPTYVAIFNRRLVRQQSKEEKGSESPKKRNLMIRFSFDNVTTYCAGPDSEMAEANPP